MSQPISVQDKLTDVVLFVMKLVELSRIGICFWMILLTNPFYFSTFAHPNKNHQKTSINNHDYCIQFSRSIRQTRVV